MAVISGCTSTATWFKQQLIQLRRLRGPLLRYSCSAPTTTKQAAPAMPATQISLSWTASTDNVGVAGYTIFRNGGKITTTASNSYSDSTLAANTNYTYTVLAFDAAGNTSAPSAPVTATTLASTASGWSVGWNDLPNTLLQDVCPPNYVDPNNSAN